MTYDHDVMTACNDYMIYVCRYSVILLISNDLNIFNRTETLYHLKHYHGS